MSNATHTPGPWKTHAQGDANEYFTLKNDGHWLAAIKFNGEMYVVEQEANVRLIDAAPELLEACETALMNLAPAYSSDHLVIKRLKNAITKAKGDK